MRSGVREGSKKVCDVGRCSLSVADDFGGDLLGWKFLVFIFLILIIFCVFSVFPRGPPHTLPPCPADPPRRAGGVVPAIFENELTDSFHQKLGSQEVQH